MPAAGHREKWTTRWSGDHARYAVFAASVLLFLGVSILANQALRALIETDVVLDHTQSMVVVADRLTLDLYRSELAARDYQRRGEPRDLELYQAASTAIPQNLEQLRRLTSDYPQQQHLDGVRPLIDETMAIIAALTRSFAPEAFSSPLFNAQIERIAVLSRQIVSELDELIDQEGQLYRGRRKAAIDNGRLTQLAIIATTGVSGLALCAVLYFMTAEIRRRRAPEADLAHLNRRLEDRVQAQTADLTQALETLRRETDTRQGAEIRLRELQRDLVRASRLTAMGQIGAMLAHEINQPLTAVLNYLHIVRTLLTAESLDGAARISEILEKAGQQTVRAGAVVQRLRDYIGKRETQQAPESLPAMIDDARTLAMTGAKPGEVSLRINLDPAARMVAVDRAQIQQVLVHLMRNAIEAMADSRRRELLVSTALRGEGMVEIAVADSGEGLSEEVRRHLFAPFVSTKPNGLGLGLSTCQSIVEAHGGKINAETRPGGGTVFRFTLHAETSRTPLSAPETGQEPKTGTGMTSW